MEPHKTLKGPNKTDPVNIQTERQISTSPPIILAETMSTNKNVNKINHINRYLKLQHQKPHSLIKTEEEPTSSNV